jgi:hypothetical protein
MGDQYVYNGKIITVPSGQTPPFGAMKVGSGAGGGQASDSSLSSFMDPAGGLSSDAFAQAQASGGGSANGPTIPVFRDRNLNDTPIGHTDSSANALEHHGANKNRSANAAEHALSQGLGTVGLPTMMNEDQAVTQFATILSDPDLLKSWANIAMEAGLVSPDKTTDAVALAAAWTTAVKWAINFKAASGGTVELTPFEAAQKVAQNTGSALLAKQAYAAAHFTGDRVGTQQTVNDQPAPEQTLHDLLGRNPTSGELAAYRHGVSEVARAHPTNTETTTHYEDGTAVSQKNVITGGYDEQQAQIDASYAATPEVAANQQATTYYDALVHAIGAAA